MEVLRRYAIEKAYIKEGRRFAHAVYYLFLGECVNFENMLNKWGDLERKYSRLGYKTVSLDAFIRLSGQGISIDNLLKQKRDEYEEPVFHAKIYRREYLGKTKPVIDIQKMKKDKMPQISTFELPSTEKFL